ncbi:MAG TPA: hypothetical protein VJ302_36960, partial [Blastocatellia bacterium]|nr:hypothetical protein [Blastocatellia bacterium]
MTAIAVVLTAAFSPTVFAQQPGPDLLGHIAQFTQRVQELMPALTSEMMGLLNWVTYLAWLLAFIIIPASAVREYHETAAQGRNLFWWFGRLACCFLLLSVGQHVIDEFAVVGKELAEGYVSADSAAVTLSPLHEFYFSQQDSFNQSLDKFEKQYFTTTVPENSAAADFTIIGEDGTRQLGVLNSASATMKDINSKLNNTTVSMPILHMIMTISVNVIEMGNVWLIILAGLLLMTFKLTCPIVIVLGIDRKLSQRVVHSWVWGLVVLTLVWPSVSYFIRALAYLGANAGLGSADGNPIYVWQDSAMKVITDPAATPVYSILFGSLIMLGAGLALWVSPLIAYQITMGRVFETVSQTASQFAGAIVGTAVEFVSAAIGARIARQAEQVQLQGNYESNTRMAAADQQAQNTFAQSRLVSQLASIAAHKKEALTGLSAKRLEAIRGAEADKAFNHETARIAMAVSKQLAQVNTDQQSKELLAGASQQGQQILANTIQGLDSVGGGTLSQIGGQISHLGMLS